MRMRPAVSSSTAQTTGTGARSEGETGSDEEEDEEMVPTENTEYTEGGSEKGKAAGG
jgi:hypothetical protein